MDSDAVTRARPSRRLGRAAGFTLVEMMVALVIGALVVAAVFSIGGASSRHFQEQQRIGVTQRAVRMAMSRLTRDIQRAGYMHVPSNRSPFVRVCPTPALPREVPAVWLANDDSDGNAALNAVQRGRNGVSADRLRLIGNYATSDQYLIDSVSAAGNVLHLQEDWLGFRRSFTTTRGGAAVADTQRFDDTFRAGRMLHLETAFGWHIFARVVNATIDSTGNTATVTISPGLGADNPCLSGLGRGTLVTPLSEVQYSIQLAPADSNLAARSNEVVGPNTQLVREELDMSNGAVLSRRVVLEYAVDFNVDAYVNTTVALGLPPNIVPVQGPATQNAIQATPWQVRSLLVSLAARTPEQDPRFPWTYGGGRPATMPLNRFQVFPDRDGAARVRQLVTEVQTPNLLPGT